MPIEHKKPATASDVLCLSFSSPTGTLSGARQGPEPKSKRQTQKSFMTRATSHPVLRPTESVVVTGLVR